ncbi:MAG: maltodextrin glucosidase [Erysipelotrichaceae bacterium]|nr:maltodextrin glucosidase [Erysipelotrichaceae bacterium]
MWYKECVFYQLYTLNFCGAPEYNNGVVEHRLHRVDPFVDYLGDLGIGAIYFNPIFSSDRHGYDTRDYCRIDERLGTNEDFKDLVARLHEKNIKVVIDGVFNHVGRGFFAFKDVLEHKWDSQYKDWFRIDFGGNSPYNDGFWYEGWEGHYELVKLNLDNPGVQHYLLDAISYWIDYFDIDGIRLDVAYLLPRWFMAMITDHAKSKKHDFFMLGEVLGDNAGYMFTEGHLDSITDYPSFKGFWSSFNSLNLFEIAHTLKRNMFDMYRGRTLLTFLDNHDVTRIASQLSDIKKLPLLFGLQLSLPGIPCIYYGSEWAQTGVKVRGQPDDDLRPMFEKPLPNELTETVKKYIHLRNQYKALSSGEMREIRLMNQQYVFERSSGDERIIIALNISDQPADFGFNANAESAIDLLTGEKHNFSDTVLEPLSIHYWLVNR